MFLVQVLLPLFDNQGHALPRALHHAVRDELTGRFGGLTAYTRAPAEGLWEDDGTGTRRDDVVLYEVMAEHLDEGWWHAYRRRLEGDFRQEQVVVRAQEIRVL